MKDREQNQYGEQRSQPDRDDLTRGRRWIFHGCGYPEKTHTTEPTNTVAAAPMMPV